MIDYNPSFYDDVLIDVSMTYDVNGNGPSKNICWHVQIWLYYETFIAPAPPPPPPPPPLSFFSNFSLAIDAIVFLPPATQFSWNLEIFRLLAHMRFSHHCGKIKHYFLIYFNHILILLLLLICCRIHEDREQYKMMAYIREHRDYKVNALRPKQRVEFCRRHNQQIKLYGAYMCHRASLC